MVKCSSLNFIGAYKMQQIMSKSQYLSTELSKLKAENSFIAKDLTEGFCRTTVGRLATAMDKKFKVHKCPEGGFLISRLKLVSFTVLDQPWRLFKQGKHYR